MAGPVDVEVFEEVRLFGGSSGSMIAKVGRAHWLSGEKSLSLAVFWRSADGREAFTGRSLKIPAINAPLVARDLAMALLEAADEFEKDRAEVLARPAGDGKTVRDLLDKADYAKHLAGMQARRRAPEPAEAGAAVPGAVAA